MRLLVKIILFCVFHVLQAGKLERIIGGTPARGGQFPYAAAIYVKTLNYKFSCGGTLISNEWIVTAGQCVDEAIEFTIHLGTTDLQANSSSHLILTSSQYFLHPKYNKQTLEHDIGLVKLRMPISFTGFINKIQFIASMPIIDNAKYTAIGWGQTAAQDPESVDKLHFVIVAALPNSECTKVFGNQINNLTVCVAGSYNEGICHGDSGNGLIAEMGHGFRNLLGTASFISGNGCEATDPSGYLRVHPYLSWIRVVTELPLPEPCC